MRSDVLSVGLEHRLGEVSLEDARKFFRGEVPHYRNEALLRIADCWNGISPAERAKIFSNCLELSDCEKDWTALSKDLPRGEAERIIITHLFGDDKNPLY